MQKLRATVSGIITHPCFHNVWWKRNAISSILWSALTESGAALFTVESNGSSCGDVSLGLEFSLSFGAFSPIVSHIHCELLTLSTIAAADLEQTVDFLSLSQFFIFMALAIKLKQQQSDFSLTDDEVTAFYGSTRGCCLLWPLWVAVHTALLIEKTVKVLQFRVI